MKLSDKCRLCLMKSSLTSDEIFCPIDPSFEKKFTEITNGRVKFAKPRNDEESELIPDLPNKACMTCVSKLEEHYNYRNGLIETQKRLNMLLGIVDEESEEYTRIKPEPYFEFENSDYEVDDDMHEDPTDELNDDLGADLSETTIKAEEKEEEEIIEKLEEMFEADYETENNYEDYEVEDQERATFEAEEVAEHSVDQNLNTRDELEEHYNTDQDCQSYVCIVNTDETEDECDVVYEEDITLEEEPRSFKRKYVKQARDIPKQFKCWIRNCGMTFSFRATMKKHMTKIHAIVCDKMTCFICGDRYDNYANFLAHVKGHTRKSECDICKLTFINDEIMQNHKARFHKKNEAERKFECHVSLWRL